MLKISSHISLLSVPAGGVRRAGLERRCRLTSLKMMAASLFIRLDMIIFFAAVAARLMLARHDFGWRAPRLIRSPGHFLPAAYASSMPLGTRCRLVSASAER